MNIEGLIIGLCAFVIIGVFHPIVVKGEYHFSKRIWPWFLVAGMVFLLLSIFVENTIGAAILGVVGFSCLWSILELKEQDERVKKGWFPRKPGREENNKQDED